MPNIIKGLIGLSVLAFCLALLQLVTGRLTMGIPAESFSRASSNLALIAIALAVCLKEAPAEKS